MWAMRLTVACVVLFVATTGQAQAASVTISSYDVTEAARSDGVVWAHVYGGTIVDTGSFTANGYAFTRADYSGGSGTLNDGSEGANTFETQLFANTTDAQPVITLYLDAFYILSDITLLTFDSGNTIPGRISGFDVTINSTTASFTSSEPTTNDEFVDLTGSTLDGLVTDRVSLSNFTHDGGNLLDEAFAIGEVVIQGSVPNDPQTVPIPAALWMGLAMLIGMGLYSKGFRGALQTSAA
jgi:hypothetical protein